MKWRQWRKHLFQAETWREMGRLKQALLQEAFDFVLDSQGLIKSACFAKMAKSLFMVWINTVRVRVAALAYDKSMSYRKVEMPFGATVICLPRCLGMQCLRRRYLVCPFLKQAV